MFEKFLVLCVMLSSLAIWGTEENASNVAKNKTPRDILIEATQGMPVPENIVEYAEYVVENRLDSCVEYSIFLSLYYLGFPEEIFAKFNIYSAYQPNIFEIKNLDLLLKRGTPRDLKKAYYYADKSTSLIRKHSDYLPVFEYKYSLLLEKLGEEKEVEEYLAQLGIYEEQSYLYLNKRPIFIEFEKNINRKIFKNERGYSGDCHIYSYLFYRGYGGFEKNLEKAKFYAEISPISYWANFYTGYACPLDPDFAIFFLEAIGTVEAQNIITKIKAGYFDNFSKNTKWRIPLSANPINYLDVFNTSSSSPPYVD